MALLDSGIGSSGAGSCIVLHSGVVMDDDTPVIVEWYTHKYIPSRRHAIVVRYNVAVRWIVQDIDLTVHSIDPSLLKRIKLYE